MTSSGGGTIKHLNPPTNSILFFSTHPDNDRSVRLLYDAAAAVLRQQQVSSITTGTVPCTSVTIETDSSLVCLNVNIDGHFIYFFQFIRKNGR